MPLVIPACLHSSTIGVEYQSSGFDVSQAFMRNNTKMNPAGQK